MRRLRTRRAYGRQNLRFAYSCHGPVNPCPTFIQSFTHNAEIRHESVPESSGEITLGKPCITHRHRVCVGGGDSLIAFQYSIIGARRRLERNYAGCCVLWIRYLRYTAPRGVVPGLAKTPTTALNFSLRPTIRSTIRPSWRWTSSRGLCCKRPAECETCE